MSDYSKYGVSAEDISNAALDDLEDNMTEKDEVDKQSSTPQKDVSFVSKDATNVKQDVKTNIAREPAVTGDSDKGKDKNKSVQGKMTNNSQYRKEKKQQKADVVASDSKTSVNSFVPKTENGLDSRFYIFSFIKNLFKKNKIGVMIWLFLNLILVSCPAGIAMLASGGEPIEIILAFALGLSIYLISLLLAFSSVGETVLRWQNKCKKIKDPAILNKISPIFNEVYSQSSARNRGISKKVKLFLCRDDSVNAFATGRRTVCITRGLLNLPDDQIKAVLSHEFGHLANRDTDIVLAATSANIIFTVLLVLLNLFINICLHISDFFMKAIFPDKANISGAMYKIINALFFVIMFLWTKLGALLCMSSSRKDEFAADRFAVDLGYGNNLCATLQALENDNSPRPKGLWATLNSSHPKTADRIAAIREYQRNGK